MIKATELRIGNLVTINNDSWKLYKDTPMQVVGIQERISIDFPDSKYSIDLFYIKHMYFSQFNEFIKPIPLTEEWLLNFGFTGSYGEFEKGDLNFDCEYTEKGEWVVFLRGENIKPVESKNEYVCKYYPKAEFKYVHQLQNLYFALTGEELTLE